MKNKVKSEVHTRASKDVQKVIESFANILEGKKIFNFLYYLKDDKGNSYLDYNSIGTIELISLLEYCWYSRINKFKGKDYADKLEPDELMAEFIAFVLKGEFVNIKHLKKLLKEDSHE